VASIRDPCAESGRSCLDDEHAKRAVRRPFQCRIHLSGVAMLLLMYRSHATGGRSKHLTRVVGRIEIAWRRRGEPRIGRGQSLPDWWSSSC
jgi:hypothetical protein